MEEDQAAEAKGAGKTGSQLEALLESKGKQKGRSEKRWTSEEERPLDAEEMRRQKGESIPRLSMGPIPKFAPPPRPKPKEGEPGWRGPVKTPPIKPSSALRMEAAVPMPKPTRPKEGAAPGSSSSTRTSWRT